MVRLALLCFLAAATSTSSSVQAQQSSSSSPGANSTATISAPSTGWFDCSFVTFADEVESVTGVMGGNASELPTAQCALFKVPLCHAGVCEDPKKRTIDVFFKRVQATSDPQSKPNVWFLQGGPGAASPAMELAMASLYKQMNGNVNVYTMDHRGTGRSTLLDCVAAQATTSGSPSAKGLSTDEVAACAKNLETKFGQDLSAFSITSAATDISTFISTYQSGSKTFVYGMSYGSTLVERLIHLDTKEIFGYILDGVSTTSGGDVKDGMYMSNWDVNFGEVSDYFLSLCSQEPRCASRFAGSSAQATLKSLLKSQNAACSGMLRDGDEMRSILGQLLLRPDTRSLIPAVLYRLMRCSYGSISYLIYYGLKKLVRASEQDVYTSTLLTNLIVFSEMWESPTPSLMTLTDRFVNASMSTGQIATMLPLYCTFTKDNSSACSSYKTVANYSAAPIAYKKDKYWNVAAKIPPQSSVLLMSGTLDVQTPHKYAERLLAALDGDNKELVTFPFATHVTLLSTAIPNAAAGTPTCGMSVLASYVLNDGDLSKLNKMCLSSMQLDWEPSKEIVKALLMAEEAYDGLYDDSGWYENSKHPKKYVTAFVVVSVCTAALVLAFVFLCVRHRKRKAAALASASKTTESEQPVTDIDDHAGVTSPSVASGQYVAAGETRV